MVASAFPSFHQHPQTVVVAAVLLGGYFALLRRWGGPGRTASTGQRVSWSVGVLVILLVGGWPLHDLAEERLYSMHMVQHLLITMAVPPLLLLGTPAWLARRLLAPPWLLATVRALSRPFVALLLFNAYIVVGHWPSFVELSLRNEPAHFAQHALLFLTATLMWMPVLSPLPEVRRLSPPGQMIYLFLQSIVPTVPASFLTLSDGVIYRVYESFPRLWGLSAIDDQRIAGLTMKLAGGLILWGFIAVVFFRWASREQGADRNARIQGVVRAPSDGVLTWEQVEEEFRRLGPPPMAPR